MLAHAATDDQLIHDRCIQTFRRAQISQKTESEARTTSCESDLQQSNERAKVSCKLFVRMNVIVAR